MDKLRSTFLLQTLLAFFTPSLLEITSADVRSVRPGESITLPCNITNYPEISWYRLRSDEVKLLISAEELKLKKTYYPSYNVNKSHFNVAQSSSSVSLVIIGVRETDLGFYYCGGRNRTHTQFGKHIRLDFTDSNSYNTVSVVISIMFTCVFCFRKPGLISPSLLQIISADLRSVGPGENITLLCNITQYSEISWYQMNSAGVRQIISARQGRLYKRFHVDYNVDESHVDVTENSNSYNTVSVVISIMCMCVFCFRKPGLISPSLLQIISADLRSVDPGENITLLCNITQYLEISWKPGVCVISSDSDEK
ncbi:uncharacterized protein DAT39_010395, partial [Clarias magur]